MEKLYNLIKNNVSKKKANYLENMIKEVKQ